MTRLSNYIVKHHGRLAQGPITKAALSVSLRPSRLADTSARPVTNDLNAWQCKNSLVNLVHEEHGKGLTTNPTFNYFYAYFHVVYRAIWPEILVLRPAVLVSVGALEKNPERGSENSSDMSTFRRTAYISWLSGVD